MSPPRIRIASGNAGKVAEVARLLAAELGPGLAGVEFCDLRGLPGHASPAEGAADYAGNARLKAWAVAALDVQAAVLADDSGLEVAALGGEPGLRAARWATGPGGEPLPGPGLNAALLARLGGLAPPARGAVMVSAVALLLPGQGLAEGRGEVAGRIALDQRGGAGFGYDAVFLLADGRRLSELQGAEKDRLSHRGAAVRAVAPALRAWLRRAQDSNIALSERPS